MLPSNFKESLIAIIFLSSIIFAFLAMFLKNKSDAKLLSAIALVTTIAFLSDSIYTYVLVILVLSTAITDQEYLTGIAAILRRDPYYWKYRERMGKAPLSEKDALINVQKEFDQISITLSFMENKILNTLWHLQALHYAELESMVTFTLLGPSSEEFNQFLVSIGKLQNAGLINQSDNKQYFLTVNGLVFCYYNFKKFSIDRWYYDQKVEEEKFDLLLKSIKDKFKLTN